MKVKVRYQKTILPLAPSLLRDYEVKPYLKYNVNLVVLIVIICKVYTQYTLYSIQCTWNCLRDPANVIAVEGPRKLNFSILYSAH